MKHLETSYWDYQAEKKKIADEIKELPASFKPSQECLDKLEYYKRLFEQSMIEFEKLTDEYDNLL